MPRRRSAVERIAAYLNPVAFDRPEVWFTDHLKIIRRRLMRDARKRAREILALIG